MTTSALPLPALCQSCGNQGMSAGPEQPAWCTCTGKRKGKRRGGPGPYVAPPGVIITFIYETKEAAARREQGRLLGNAERTARDEAVSARWATYMRGGVEHVRAVPVNNPKRRAAEAAYDAALAALEAFQVTCPHPTRCHYFPEFCDVCHGHVPTLLAEAS